MLDLLGNGIITMVGSIAGVVVGWLLNEHSRKKYEKPHLCFKLSNTPDDELIESNLRTKTSASEYSIEIFNVGQTPVLLENFGLYHKRKILVDCHIIDMDKAIMPYQCKIYTLSEQEKKALERHCEEKSLKHCKVLAWDVDGKKIKTKIDVSWITLRAELRNTNTVL